jgi:hypothetical protein
VWHCGVEGDLLEQKRIGIALEEAIDRVDERRRGAVIRDELETIALDDRFSRVDVGKDVGAAKPVDRLLRVADHVVAAVLRAFIDTLEYTVLQGIGVLKLIHHRDGKAPSRARSQRSAARPTQGSIHLHQQVVGGKQAIIELRGDRGFGDLADGRVEYRGMKAPKARKGNVHEPAEVLAIGRPATLREIGPREQAIRGVVSKKLVEVLEPSALSGNAKQVLTTHPFIHAREHGWASRAILGFSHAGILDARSHLIRAPAPLDPLHRVTEMVRLQRKRLVHGTSQLEIGFHEIRRDDSPKRLGRRPE